MTRSGKLTLSVSLLVALLAFGVVGWMMWSRTGSPEVYEPHPPGSLTFSNSIAPIVFEHCSGCHRPGESAPFSLLTYRDVERRATQIQEVTRSRFMPPWLPEPGHGEFSGQRSLSTDQIGRIQQWVAEGSVEGDASAMPPAPDRTEGWQLGEPDLVVKMVEPYTLASDGTDVFRNFIIPITVPTTRYVRTFELRPGNPRVVHHAQVRIDRARSARHHDEQDTEPGFDGMQATESLTTDGHLLGWTPGKLPYEGREDMAWRVDPGTDLVLQLHLLPSGKPEVIQSSIGLFFSDRPPTQTPVVLRLGSKTIDIPAGKTDYVIEDSYQLPVDVEVLGVYPHAHYLAQEMKAFAKLPDGTTQWLIWIQQWDFNWQDEYRYSRPLFLPGGTKITMQYTYDNSSSNVRNPHHPPRRVVYGPQSSDEMGELWIQVLPRKRFELTILKTSFVRKDRAGRAAGYRHALQLNPDDPQTHYDLGTVLSAKGHKEEAITHYRQALHLRPRYYEAHYNLGNALMAQEKPEEAIEHYRQALKIRPNFSGAHYNLGYLLARQGSLVEAAVHLEQVLQIQPDNAGARSMLQRIRAQQADP